MHLGLLKDYLRFLAGDQSILGRSVGVFAQFISGFRSPAIMSVSNEVQEFIYTSLAENNKALLDQISNLVAVSAESIKRSSVEAADDQLREIKKLRRGESKSLERKGNEVQYKFSLKLQDTLDYVKSHFESNAADKAKSSL